MSYIGAILGCMCKQTVLGYIGTVHGCLRPVLSCLPTVIGCTHTLLAVNIL